MDVQGARNRGGGSRRNGAASSPPAAAGETRAIRAVWLVTACMTLPTLVFVSGAYKPILPFFSGVYPSASHPPREPAYDAAAGDFYGASDETRDRYLGGLLAPPGFDQHSCLSRYQSSMYRNPSPHKPSPFLVQRLRAYEERHRRCGPHSASYNMTLAFLTNGKTAPEKETECKYIVWIAWRGLGNRILTLASTFLYALLTDRVVLIDGGKDLSSLFCEPFPATTWLLPPDFPIKNFDRFNRDHPQTYGNLLRRKQIHNGGGGGQPPPSFVYLHINSPYSTEDTYLFCEPDQVVLRRVPWLLVRSDNYFVPGLFLNRDFEPELARLFPEKETVFHHLCRYLFHPTNNVWGMITRYYRANMAMAREKLGIQIRVFSPKDSPFEVVAQQVINCTLKEKLLLNDENATGGADPRKTKSVLLTSLHTGYLDKIRGMYREHPTAGGDVVNVHQPSHEEWQKTDTAGHDAKAWAEMNLLSFADVLVTSARSTFGYIGQGLGGIRPWILLLPEKAVVPEPTCVRDISMEPCFHSVPSYVCREKRFGDNGKVVPFVVHCVDVPGGVKLVDRN